MKIKLDKGAYVPVRAHDTDAGLDLRAPRKKIIPRGGAAVIHTGVHIELPPGTCGIMISKSGLNVKHGLTSTGLIDEGYSGEIVVKLYNHSKSSYMVLAGEKISQLVIVPVLYEPVEIVDEITGGARGENGFGSTGP